jgi:cell division protein ZipA
MGLRELLILIVILAIVGVILRGLYVAISSRRGQLKIALEKNVPVYDLEEIEFREFPNGGARVVERSFAHVMKQNSRFATPAKTAAAKYGRGGMRVGGVRSVSAAGSAMSTSSEVAASTAAVAAGAASAGVFAAGTFAAPSAVSSQSIPTLMNSVSDPDFGFDDVDLDLTDSVLDSALAVPVLISPTPVINSAKEAPCMDDLISALENELDAELKAHQTPQSSAALGRNSDDEAVDTEKWDDEDLSSDSLSYESLDSEGFNSGDSNTAADEPSDDEAFSQNDSHQEDLDPDDDDDSGDDGLNKEQLERGDITYMEPELIEVELLGRQYDVERAVKQPPVLENKIETPATIQDSIDEDVMYRKPGDDDFDDDDEDLPEDDRDDDDDEEQLADNEFGDEFQQMFAADSLSDDDILGVDRADDRHADDSDDDFDDDDDADYRDEQNPEPSSGGLMGWAGAKWAAVSAGLAAAADQRRAAAEEKQELLQRRQAEAEERSRQRAQQKALATKRADPILNDDDDILLDDPFSELSAPRETPRVQQPLQEPDQPQPEPRQPQQKPQQQPRQPQPQQRSLLECVEEDALLSAELALHEDDTYDDNFYEEAAPAAKAPKKTVTRKTPKAEEPRNTQNNNIDPEYNEVLIINVMSRSDREFAGVDVLQALLSCGMRFGDMNIFHRHVDDRGTGPVLFSIANAVNPGTFDLNKINDFSTRGLCFFLTLPNVINNMQAFNKMLDVAQKLRSMLDGEMKDDNRSVMTAQTVEHYRQRIRDFELLQLRQSPKQGK